ncbi:MAG: hypothetical protein ACREPG_11160, partial [Candidatus Binatia bacterium]
AAGDFKKFRDAFTLLGKHLGHAQTSFQNADRRLEQFGQQLLSAESGQPHNSTGRLAPSADESSER